MRLSENLPVIMRGALGRTSPHASVQLAVMLQRLLYAVQVVKMKVLQLIAGSHLPKSPVCSISGTL